MRTVLAPRQLYDLHNPEPLHARHALGQSMAAYNLKFSTDYHVQQSLHAQKAHVNHETARFDPGTDGYKCTLCARQK
jgi:hypothetical protein